MGERLRTTIGELAAPGPGAVSTGPFGSSVSAVNFRESGVPLIRGKNLSDDVGVRLRESEFVYLAPSKAAEFARSTAKRGDLVFTCWGTIGQIGFIDERSAFSEYIVSNKQMKLTVDGSKAVGLFVYYYLSQASMLEYVKEQAIGSSVPGFNLGQLKALPISLPPLAEQRAIAEVLGALDDKIAANTKLAAIAWEVARTEYMSAMQLADASLLLGDAIALEYGKALPSSRRVSSGAVMVVGSGGVGGFHDEALVTERGVVVGRKGTAGAVHWIDGPHWPIDTTFYVRPTNAAVSQAFAYFWLQGLRLDEMNADSAVPGLNRSEALALKTKLPQEDVLHRFTARATPLIDLAGQLSRESRTLAATRDALLPALMSGTLRVRDLAGIAS